MSYGNTTIFPVSPPDAAAAYLARGFAPLPLVARSKRPVMGDWPNFRAAPAHLSRFTECNVGLLLGEPSGGLMDIDLDCPEAMWASDLLLPPTGLEFGRPSAPRSHRLYRCPDFPPAAKLSDPVHRDGRVLVELRSTAQQTMVPPSVHPCGELIEWTTFVDPATIGGTELTAAVKAVASAALLGRYWPRGGRHDAGLALAGGLLRAGWAVERAETFIRAVCAAANDEEVRDRVAAVSATAARLGQPDGKATGWPVLTQLFGTHGKSVVTAVTGWLAIDRPSGPAGRLSEASGASDRSKAQARLHAPTARRVPEWVPFPTGRIPIPAVREYIVRTAEAMNCDEAFVTLPVLTALGAAVGTTHVLSPKRGWREPPVVWAVAIGPSGTTKSPPYRDVEDMAQDINDRLEEEYQTALVAHQQRMEEWKRSKDEGEDCGDPPPPPPRRVFMTSDCTVEALVEILNDNRRGVLVGRDELAGWVGGFGRYSSGRSGSSDLQNWLQLSNAGTVDYCRRTGNPKRVRVRGAAAAVCGTTQPGVIAAVLTPELREAGLFARLLPAYPPVRRRTWTEAEVPDGVRQGVAGLMNTLFDLRFETGDDGWDRPHLVRLGDEAKTLFIAFYDRNGAAMDSADDDLRAAMSKLEGYALRFALLFHCCRFPSAPADERVGEEDMAAAVALTDWFVRESDRVYRLLGESVEDRTLRTLADQVRRKADRHAGRLTVRQLQNGNSRRYPNRELAEADLEQLVDAGFGTWVSPEPTGCGGHREKWYVPASPTSDTSDGWPDNGGDVDLHDGDQPGHDGGSDPSHLRSGGVGDTLSPSEFTNKSVSEVSDVGLTATDEEEQPLAPTPVRVSEVSDVGPVGMATVNGLASSPSVRVSESSDVVGPAPTRPVVRTGGPEDLPQPMSMCGGGEPSTPPEPPPVLPVTPTSGHRLVTDRPGMERLVTALRTSRAIGLDLETTGLDPRTDRVRLLSVHTPTGTFLVDCFAVDPVPLFGPLAEVEVVGHNLLFDLQFLVRLGFTPDRVWDTMLASQVLEAGDRSIKHSLLEVVGRHLDVTMDKAEQASDWGGELTPAQLAYAAADVEVLLPLRAEVVKKLRSAKLTATADLENRALLTVVWMASTGVGFDRPAWQSLAGEAGCEASTRNAELNSLAACRPDGKPRNWNSVPQVKEAFAAVGVTLTTTADEALAAVDHPLATALRAYRAAVKRAGTYGTDWLRHVSADGRVHPGWRQCGADSGRMACREPNVQNLPRDPRYRRCFVAPPRRLLVKADYSQIELRLAARIANEPTMLAAYRDGKDLHTETAKAILGKAEVTKADRQLAKALNFGLLYGMGVTRLAEYARTNYGVVLTTAEAVAHRDKFFTTYHGLASWHRRVAGGPRKVSTRTPLGRRRSGVTSYPERLNTPVQGAGADGLKAALALLWERRADCPTAVPVLAVHDEIVVECEAGDADAVSSWLTRAMVDGMTTFADPVPVVVEVTVGPTWGG